MTNPTTTTDDPETTIDRRFSMDQAMPTPWSEAVRRLEAAELFWLSTIRPDGRPHVTPLLSVWLDGACHFCTGEGEQKARNLRNDERCSLTTGSATLDDGIDLVVEGHAERVLDERRLQHLADAWEAKYGREWRFEVHDGAFYGKGGAAHVYRVAPVVAFGFAKGTYGQTRWRFGRETATRHDG